MSVREKRIVLHYVGCEFERGGVCAVIRNLAATNVVRVILGVNPDFQSPARSRLHRWRGPRVEAETISVPNVARALVVAWRVRRWLKGGAHRVFHGHSRSGMLVGCWLALFHERRVVVTVHCYGRHRWFYRWSARTLGDRLYWLSPAMKRYYGIGGAGWSQCIPGCVGTHVVPVAQKRDHQVSVLRTGGIGVLVRWKRWHLVLEALAALPAQFRGRVTFSHIGGTDGSEDSREYAAELKQRTGELQLTNVVEWCGEQPSSAPLLSGVDCVIVASHNEPLSVAMLEALQAHIPVVAADSGGASDVIAPSRNGWLFRDGDAGELARVLTSLIETDALRSVTFAEESRFAARTVADQFVAVYERLEAT